MVLNIFKISRSIDGLIELNKLGYGKTGSNLILNLVYNPQGTDLPPLQSELEKSYRKELLDSYGIEFTNLYTITNMPIKRFANELQKTKSLEFQRNIYLDSKVALDQDVPV